MNIRTPITALALALGLACTPAFATQPMEVTTAPVPGVQAHQPMRHEATRPIVASMRKVYSFKLLDRNHNGMLSRSEIPTDMVNLRRDFTRADFDGNGQLTPEEYILYSRGQAPKYTGVFHYHTYTFSTGNRNVEVIRMRAH